MTSVHSVALASIGLLQAWQAMRTDARPSETKPPCNNAKRAGGQTIIVMNLTTALHAALPMTGRWMPAPHPDWRIALGALAEVCMLSHTACSNTLLRVCFATMIGAPARPERQQLPRALQPALHQPLPSLPASTHAIIGTAKGARNSRGAACHDPNRAQQAQPVPWVM